MSMKKITVHECSGNREIVIFVSTIVAIQNVDFGGNYKSEIYTTGFFQFSTTETVDEILYMMCNAKP